MPLSLFCMVAVIYRIAIICEVICRKAGLLGYGTIVYQCSARDTLA